MPFLTEDDADRLLKKFEQVAQQLDEMERRLVAAAQARGLIV